MPRSETEYMVELLIEIRQNAGRPFSSLLDIGTGSGVILLTLLDRGFASRGTGSDLSSAALQVAQINSHRLRCHPMLIIGDRFQNISDEYEVIVSNPPYIKKNAHASGVHRSVDVHEPHLALYLGDDEYESWFEQFFSETHRHLKGGGLFMMEGHELELESQASALERLGFINVRVIKDLTGRMRFLQAFKA